MEDQLSLSFESADVGVSFDEPAFSVEVTRSKRRKKTAEARLRGDTIEIRIPAATSLAEEQEFIDHFSDTFYRQRASKRTDISARAIELATEYELPEPSEIKWVANQQHRWGSCTPADKTIRISNRLASFPSWVIDYVIMHELAHLVVFDHNEQFWELVARYPLSERARGYLMAKDGV